MFLGRVVGELVSTLKHDALRGERLLWVVRTDPGGRPLVPQRRILALDRVDAGPGDRVLVVDEGNSAAQVLERPRGPVRTVIVGVVDQVEIEGRAGMAGSSGRAAMAAGKAGSAGKAGTAGAAGGSAGGTEEP